MLRGISGVNNNPGAIDHDDTLALNDSSGAEADPNNRHMKHRNNANNMHLGGSLWGGSSHQSGQNRLRG
jgi:hypothetical protein